MKEKLYYDKDYKDISFRVINKPRISSVDDWKLILREELMSNDIAYDFVRNVLIEIYYAPNKTVYCKDLEKKIGRGDLNLQVWYFKKRITQYNIVNIEKQEAYNSLRERTWNIPFYSDEKLNVDGKFCWILRPELAQAMEELGVVSKEDNKVMTFPINGTEELIKKYHVHAHPVKKGYPKIITPFIAFRNKGIIDRVYKVLEVKECRYNKIDEISEELSVEQYNQLNNYVEGRKTTFGFSNPDTNYRFFIFEEYKSLTPEYVVNNIQNAKLFNLRELLYYSIRDEKVLFCNVSYMQHYDYMNFKEVPINGGGYVDETGDALEKYNFHLCEDGLVRGFVETKYVGGYKLGAKKTPKQLHIEKIDYRYKKENVIEGVNVVFCAKKPNEKNSTVIVGWYRNAKVFRNREEYYGREYNLQAEYKNTFILPISDRLFSVPRSKNSDFGFGQSNVWYANDEETIDFVSSVIEFMDEYESKYDSQNNKLANDNEDNILNDLLNQEVIQINDNFKYGGSIEPRKEAQISNKGVLTYPRDRQKAINAVIHSGFKCEIDGNHETFAKKSDGLPYLEAHHLIPMAQQVNFANTLDTEENIVSLCSNCHNEIHYGINAKKLIVKLYKDRKDLLKQKGIYVTIDELLSFYELE